MAEILALVDGYPLLFVFLRCRVDPLETGQCNQAAVTRVITMAVLPSGGRIGRVECPRTQGLINIPLSDLQDEVIYTCP